MERIFLPYSLPDEITPAEERQPRVCTIGIPLEELDLPFVYDIYIFTRTVFPEEDISCVAFLLSDVSGELVQFLISKIPEELNTLQKL